MPPVKINGQIVELSSCLLLLSVVGPCALSVPSREAGGRAMPRHREWGNESEREQRRQRDRDKETGRKGDLGRGGRKRGEAERDREGVKASRDTSRCQTHRHTAATDSSSQPRLQAQLDTGNEWTGEEDRRRGTRGRGGKRQIGYYSWPKSAQKLL